MSERNANNNRLTLGANPKTSRAINGEKLLAATMFTLGSVALLSGVRYSLTEGQGDCMQDSGDVAPAFSLTECMDDLAGSRHDDLMAIGGLTVTFSALVALTSKEIS